MSGLAVSPRWARAYLAYERRVPNHPGKATLMRTLVRAAGRDRAFGWPAQNGTLLALAPAEGLAPFLTAGWTCLHYGEWEPHVERCLRGLLRPGDVVVDGGANFGYFSAAMAQAVGATGAVYAFEPVPDPFRRLCLCSDLNGFAQLHAFPIALGEDDGEAQIGFDRRATAMASLYRRDCETATVPVRSLDSLLAAGEIAPPAVIKLDVEGHELAVLRGAQATIARARPAVVFELNEPMMRAAGWSFRDVADVLPGYRFELLREGGTAEVEPEEEILGPGDYVDVLATPR